ncbi:hypothetical protein E2C01_069113 [Portunus trituberculatus]|uniref:Uncharacterized protein n=1 Tax=Portunus trituberculatus TaxID=210409 RepID=A0A5B7HYI5_PORTR|nr:hypothetical protein [Portunus trituberculatus]
METHHGTEGIKSTLNTLSGTYKETQHLAKTTQTSTQILTPRHTNRYTKISYSEESHSEKPQQDSLAKRHLSSTVSGRQVLCWPSSASDTAAAFTSWPGSVELCIDDDGGGDKKREV